jgi:DNA-binding MarR family transcriptional regulator
MEGMNKTEVLELTPKELVIMSNLYLNINYPHNFITLSDAANLLNMSKATTITVMKELDRKGFILKERGYVTFYYPIKNGQIRKGVLAKLGFFKNK